MQTLNLRVDENFFPHFKVMLDSFVKDKKVEIIEDTFPKHLIASSVEDVRKRVYEAEQEQSVSQEEYDKLMNAFFASFPSSSLGMRTNTYSTMPNFA